MKEIKSPVDVDIMDMFPSWYPYKSFINFVANFGSVESFIATAGVLMPNIIEVNGCIILKENYPYYLDIFNVYKEDIKTIERKVNLLALTDLHHFLSKDSPIIDEALFVKEAQIIVVFWKQYLKSLYPNKIFEFEIGEDGLLDEFGVCITFSQSK
jgi:hypothetical protein